MSRSRFTSALTGPSTDPRWARPALLTLLVATFALYAWHITDSGYANEFYAAAVKSATMSWKAWLFGSLDSASSITVDKPPASLWVMGLSARIFGFSSASMLLPQALMGVATVGLTAGSVRRWAERTTASPAARHASALVAGTAVMLTPVAALMFRFNNPDALLVLLMSFAGYAVTRAAQTARGRSALRWMMLAGAAIGVAFLTKMIQGFLVLPGLGLAYLLAARHSLRARLGHLLAALGALVVAGGWFVALVSLWPASSRPYIGGSTNNSLWELALGYNGLSRILGGQGNGGGGGAAAGGNTSFGGATGLLRMFGDSFGAEVSWFLPAALVLLVAGLLARGRRPRTDGIRAGLVLFGGWTLVTAAVFSFMEGTVHPYYAVALVPGIGGTVALGALALWQARRAVWARTTLGLSMVLTSVWAYHLLLLKAAAWLPWVKWVGVVGATLGAVVVIVVGGLEAQRPAGPARSRLTRLTAAAVLVGALSASAGSAAYTVATAATGHSGSIPVSGPAGYVSGGMGGGATGAGTGPGTGGGMPGTAPSGTAPSGSAPSGSASSGTASSGSDSTGSSTSLDQLLASAGTTWSAATVGDQSAAGYILSSGTAVMSIGGWSGADDNVTLAQFEALVSSGQIHYFIAGGQGGQGGGPGGSSGAGSEITAWVTSHFTATTVGGTTVYDLTEASTAASSSTTG